ncbi:MAG: hypothetical protein KME28_18900 [Pelatocladus maniniholoensis HA4357-MV3]|jgi:hypothetical protein|uniref:Uncharacterized protein n=1 Tax=Pelatocladus maniniholoensis HA4357-MV3 TaxID=1117104 RepID=A0A9E3LUW0_9NOST|nr:hypothetical protein [Pelatocladus maniniholoensis HA4357-MV3]
MVRNIRWDESVLENVLSLVDALLLLAEQQPEDLKAALVVKWETNKLRFTGYQTKQASGKRSRTIEYGTKKEDLLHQIKQTGQQLKASCKI